MRCDLQASHCLCTTLSMSTFMYIPFSDSKLSFLLSSGSFAISSSAKSIKIITGKEVDIIKWTAVDIEYTFKCFFFSFSKF